MSKHTYGLRASEHRHKYTAYSHNLGVADLPKAVDLRPQFPPAYDQGQFNSCTANTIAAAMQYLSKEYMPSRMFIYFNERDAKGESGQDSGSTYEIGLEATRKFGAPPEPNWPYTQQFLFERPTAEIYKEAHGEDLLTFQTIEGLDNLKHSLSMGFPVAIGMVVYNSFESDAVAATGELPIPGPGEQPQGGHAVLCVGYDDDKQHLIVRNSWGTGWGVAGYFYMPYAYATNPQLCFDWWSLQKAGAELGVTRQAKKSWWATKIEQLKRFFTV